MLKRSHLELQNFALLKTLIFLILHFSACVGVVAFLEERTNWIMHSRVTRDFPNCREFFYSRSLRVASLPFNFSNYRPGISNVSAPKTRFSNLSSALNAQFYLRVPRVLGGL